MRVDFNTISIYKKAQNKSGGKKVQIRFNNAGDTISFGEKKDIEYTPIRNGNKIKQPSDREKNLEGAYNEGYKAGYTEAQSKITAALEALDKKHKQIITILYLVLSMTFVLFYRQNKIEEIESTLEQLQEDSEDTIEDLIYDLPTNYESAELKKRLGELVEDYEEYIENNQ